MVRTIFRLVVLLPLLAACAAPGNEGNLNRVPAFVPANAAPPMIADASNDLVGAVWLWQGTQQVGAPAVAPQGADRYTLAFQGGGRVNLRADCNRGAGPYEVNGVTMKMGPFALTKMMCAEGSRDGEFLRDLERVATYGVTRGQLTLTLANGSAMRFNRQP
jgi:heat shock protein HslJ